MRVGTKWLWERERARNVRRPNETQRELGRKTNKSETQEESEMLLSHTSAPGRAANSAVINTNKQSIERGGEGSARA